MVAQLNTQISQGNAGNRFEVRWQIVQKLLPEFITECKSKRIIKIGPYLPKLSQKDCIGV